MYIFKLILSVFLCVGLLGLVGAAPLGATNQYMVQIEPGADIEAVKINLLAQGTKILNSYAIGQFRALLVSGNNTNKAYGIGATARTAGYNNLHSSHSICSVGQ
jgi:hypothetical protein